MAATQYLPDGQGRHAEAATPFVAGLYVPTPQSICSPTGQYFPAGQCSQLPAAVALAALYVPAGHTVCVADAAGQKEPAGHASQEAAVAPSVLRNVPAAQGMATDMPAVLQKVPGGHCRQAAGDVAPEDAE